MHDNRYSLNENSKTKKKKCTNENRNVWCKICECQNFNHVFFSTLRQCFQNTFVTIYSLKSNCYFILWYVSIFETTICLFEFEKFIDNEQYVKHSEFRSTKHCESNLDKIISNNSIIEIR